jgi:tetratricopeptide (TPR) repeat protein
VWRDWLVFSFVKGQRFIPVLVVLAGLLAYHNCFTGPFIFDDRQSIPENPTIRHLWPIWQALSPPHNGGLTVEGRPLVNFSLAINYALGGTDVRGYHALNLAIHILAGLTLLGVVRRTLLQPGLRERFGAAANGLALATAVLWTVHPLQTESVTYIVQRAESIMGLFYLATLYFFIRGVLSARPRLWYGLCVAACALGMASKEVMASAPLMVMLYDRTFVSGSLREAWRRRGPLYLALASTWIVLGCLLLFARSVTNDMANAIVWWRYLLTEPGVILHYLRLSLWPHPLCFDYYGPIVKTWMSILPPALVIAILLGASACAWSANSVWGFVSAWFFLILAPTSSFLPTDSPMYEHRMYLSLAAIVATATVGGFELGRNLLGRQQQTRKMLQCAGAGALVLVLTILTIQRNQDYRSELTIWGDTVAKRPNNPRAQNNLGLAVWQTGKVQEAIGHYEQAIRIRPDYADAHYNLGNALLQAGRLQDAISHYEQAVRIRPDYADAHYNLGVALKDQGKAPEAMAHYEQALRINPDYAEAHCNLGVALQQVGQVPEAVEHYEQALRLKPDLAEAHYNLGSILYLEGRVPEAIVHFEQALRIKPTYAEAHNNLGAALIQVGRVQEAIPHFEQALRIKPDYAEAKDNLARARAVQ